MAAVSNKLINQSTDQLINQSTIRTPYRLKQLVLLVNEKNKILYKAVSQEPPYVVYLVVIVSTAYERGR